MSETKTPAKVHPFERAGLGLPPFRCVGMEVKTYQACHGAPIQPGAACDYCGTGITNCYAIQSADGKRFVVGSDCVMKCERECAGTDAEKVARKLHEDVLRVKRAAAHKRDDAKIAAIAERLASPGIRRALAAIPHSLKWRAEQGGTRLEELDWLMANAGRAGKLRVGKGIDAAIASMDPETTDDPERPIDPDAIRETSAPGDYAEDES